MLSREVEHLLNTYMSRAQHSTAKNKGGYIKMNKNVPWAASNLKAK